MSNYGPRDQYYGAPGAPQPIYDTQSSYQPPRNNSIRNDMAVTRYDEESAQYTDNRGYGGSRTQYSRDRYDDDGRYYDGRRSSYDNDRRTIMSEQRNRYGSRSRSRRRSSTSRRSGEEGERGLFGGEGRGGDSDHHRSKELGATVVGGAVGAFAGHEFGHHNKMVSTIGALAGAFAGHELEKRHERKKERRESQRELQRGESNYQSRTVEDGYSDDGGDEDDYRERRRHDHSRRRRDSGRYD